MGSSIQKHLAAVFATFSKVTEYGNHFTMLMRRCERKVNSADENDDKESEVSHRLWKKRSDENFAHFSVSCRSIWNHFWNDVKNLNRAMAQAFCYEESKNVFRNTRSSALHPNEVLFFLVKRRSEGSDGVQKLTFQFGISAGMVWN